MHVTSSVHPSIQARAAAALRTSAAVATALAALAVNEAHAAAMQRVERDFVADKGPIAVEVRVAGRSTALYNGSARPDRWYLEAKKGQKYEIRVRNTTGERIGFVLAVDGLNAIDGTLSRNASSEPMYVLEPYADATIKGWRRNLDQVSRFVFVDEQRSYAERTGQGNGDLGWIRVTAFHEVWTVARTWGTIRGQYHGDGPMAGDAAPRAEEKEAAPPSTAPAPESRRDRASSGMGVQGETSRAPVADANPGTGWGPTQRDRVREVEFVPRAYAAAQVILRYEYKPTLVALGILPWNPPASRTWERERGLYGFAQPPRDGR